MEHRIVYFSPAGTTRKAAEAIGDFLRDRGQAVSRLDLARRQNPFASFGSDSPPFRLWLGSPVYCDHAVPLVEDFVRSLPPAGGFAVPFVTWGAVTSGLALPEMAACLAERGFAVLGAAQVMAEHSSLWQSSQPLAGGRPGPFPVIDDSCILCRQCTRHCPAGAYPYDGAAVEIRIRGMAKQSVEAKETEVFV
ncbi:MAG: 4Fe-4S binding protein [Trichloromonas sp.]|nr:4Fe-4S binding protein [Trichloromonas sp.]